MSPALRRHWLPLAAATTISVIALMAITGQARAQEGQQPPPAPADAQAPVAAPAAQPDLPPVVVEQPEPPAAAAPAAEPKPAKKKTAAAPPKKKPKPVPAPEPVASTPEPVAPPPEEPSDPATALGTYNPALATGNLELPPGTTLTTAGPVDGYRALTSFSSTKTATPIERIPQNIQVVPQSLIDDQRTLSVDEALRNVSGAQGNYALSTPAFDSTTIRGFAAEQWLDGLAVYYNPGDRDSLANVERIEVLKGPSAILYGGGAGAPVGGAVNVVSKLPTDKASGEIGFTFGSDRYLQPYIDINQPLNSSGTVLFRVTGEYTNAESFIDVIETERYSINPTLTLTNKTDTTLTVQGRANRWEQPEYQGLPATGTVAGAFDIDRTLFIGPDDVPDSYSEVQGVTVTLDHKISEAASLNVKARWSRSEFAERVQTLVGADSFQGNVPFLPPSTWALSNALLFQEQDEFTINPNMQFKFGAGPTENMLLIGADYSRVSDNGFLTADAFIGGAGIVDLDNPVFGTPYIEPGKSPFTTFQDAVNEYTTKGAYVQLQSSIYDRLHLLGGLRLANVEIVSFDPVTFTDDETDETRLLPRAGAVLDIVPGISVYGSYSEGLRGNPFVNFTGAPEPEESTQYEAGFKLSPGFGLTGTIAVFEIERSNVPVTVGFVTTATGEERSRGFETDWLWQPDDNWSVLANYAYIDAELTKATAGAPAGSALIGIPEHSGRFWINYAFDPGLLGGWSVGAGIYAASDSPVDLANTFFAESYNTVDAKIAYAGENFEAALNIKNLTDEEYFVPYSYFGGRVAPGQDRAVYGTVIYKY